jgi:ferredoxin
MPLIEQAVFSGDVDMLVHLITVFHVDVAGDRELGQRLLQEAINQCHRDIIDFLIGQSVPLDDLCLGATVCNNQDDLFEYLLGSGGISTLGAKALLHRLYTVCAGATSIKFIR